MKWAPLLVLALLALPLPLPAETVPPKTETFTLANGLEVIVIPNHRVPAVSHMIWYRVGAADDPPEKSGLAHFHEHMMYQGTTRIPPGQYAELIAAAGGEQNAFTGADATAYYITIAKEQLPLAMMLEADRMGTLVVPGNMAIKEKEIIIEERRMRIENNPAAMLYEQMNASLFRNHPYRLPVIGWMHEMEGLNKVDVMRFHTAWHHPNNAVLILSGDITAKEAEPLVRQYYGGLPRAAVPARRWASEPPQNTARRVVMHHPNVKQPMWARSYMTSSLGYGVKEQGLPTLLLSQLLGGGKTSALYRSLVVDKKLASDVSTGYDVFTIGPSRFEISATPAAGVSMEQIEKAVEEELARAASGEFAAADIIRAKTLLKAESVYARDGLSSMARIMGWIRMTGLSYDYFQEWPKLVEAVTPAQIKAAAIATLRPEQSVTGELLPEEGKK